MMKMVSSETINVSIFIGGDLAQAKQVCREWCMSVGACVTVDPVDYIYTGGEEAGVRVGFINYPRYPAAEAYIVERATALASLLMDRLCQHSFSIVAPTETVWCSRREETNPVNAELLAVAEMFVGLKDKDGKRTPTNAEIDAARDIIEKAKCAEATRPTGGIDD